MRMFIAALAAASIAGLAVTANAAPDDKKKQRPTAGKERLAPPARGKTEEFGYDATPEHYRFGSRDWWRAMEREGRGGFGDTM